ncbi:MAG: hypothetical protein A2X97_16900 [Bdellovibrionales bacterium GWA1_52_35]|nr:MAG: hypothetical protein A2X97_16900 [Bdellovibrionales bacterium GWA1_52_35]
MGLLEYKVKRRAVKVFAGEFIMNHLAEESSPYLTQHQTNPVDWYPWGDEALTRARKENKPIFLSIGYSACHWCHVMEQESFEDQDIARLLNERFISIKVDREERPDLDQIYQPVAQALTGGGGWPLSVFLTPELKPFFGGTYFPPTDKFGRPGFLRLIAALGEAYENEISHIQANARQLTELIQRGHGLSQIPAADFPQKEELLAIAQELLRSVDQINGGMLGAPKFPNPSFFSFLWRIGSLNRERDLMDAVVLTLRKMATGGIYDQLGGGFHRYSVDESWTIPHFEKMLYDNGLLLKLYSEVLLSASLTEADRSLFADVVRSTSEYLLREMRVDGLAFACSQDADSEGGEGNFFSWSAGDLQDSALGLTPEEQAFAKEVFGITEAGNFEHGKTVLSLTRAVLPEERIFLQEIRRKIFVYRESRPKPARDHKILGAWNGLAVSGISWASLALKDSSLANEGAKAFDALVSVLVDQEREVLKGSIQNGKAKLIGNSQDYAFLAMAALDLSRCQGDERYLQFARTWMRNFISEFRDSQEAGYFLASKKVPELIYRPKDIFDHAMPSSTGIALEILVAVDAIVSDDVIRKELSYQLNALAGVAKKFPSGCSGILNAFLLAAVGPVTLAANLAGEWNGSPFVFPVNEPRALGCHRQTCFEFKTGGASVSDWVRQRLDSERINN